MSKDILNDWRVTGLIINVVVAHVTGILVLLAASRGLEIADRTFFSPPSGTAFFEGRLKASVFFDAFDIFIILGFFPFAIRALIGIWRRTRE